MHEGYQCDNADIASQSHHTGIEIREVPASHDVRYPLNRTILELKSGYILKLTVIIRISQSHHTGIEMHEHYSIAETDRHLPIAPYWN